MGIKERLLQSSQPDNGQESFTVEIVTYVTEAGVRYPIVSQESHNNLGPKSRFNLGLATSGLT